MKSKDITFAYFILDTLDENIFLKNTVKNQSQNIIIVTHISYQPKIITGFKNIKINSFNLSDYIEQIFENISTNWLMIMKPEEAFIYHLEAEKLKPGVYTVAVEKCINQNKVNNLIYGEIKLYHKDYKVNNEIGFTNASIFNYTGFFPEIEKNKIQLTIDDYRKGDKSLKTILYLLEKRIINLEPDYLLENYYNETDDSYQTLELLRHISRLLIIKKDLEKAKEIIFKALLNFPNSPCMNSLLSEVHFMQKNYKEAEFFVSKCISMGRDNSFYMYLPFSPAILGYAAYYFLGKIYYQMKDLVKAKISFEECLELKPDFRQALEDHKRIMEEMEESKEYANELNFACQGCGNCCRHFSKVNINHRDIVRILDNKPDLDYNNFFEYYYDENLKIPLFNIKKKSDSTDCIFLEDNKCSINSFKPLGCKVWPFVLRKNDNVTWSVNNRAFIKENCAYTEIEGSNDKEELTNNLKCHKNEAKELIEIFKQWDGKINNSENKLSNQFMEYLENNYSNSKTT